MSPTLSLRTRLIIAFLLLSVVPLTAVTLLSYRSSVQAFERAAQREATESAADVSRRMEVITADVGRRMDRLFVAGTSAPRPFRPDPDRVRDSVAPLLGDAAALVDRVEFHPAADLPAPPPEPAVATQGVRPAPRAAPPAPASPAKRSAPPVPPGASVAAGVATMVPPVMVIDIPRILEQTARAATAGGGAVLGTDFEKQLQKSLEQQVAASQEALKAMAETATRQAGALEARDKVPLDIESRRVEVAVRKDGRLLGRANATLNMDRTMRTVLALVRRDQGEIPFALDRTGAVYTPEGDDRARLQGLGAARLAPVAATSGPQRAGDWIIVARKDPGGIIFGIARPVGDSLREIRRASVRNLSLGLLVIGLAFIGIVPISHRMTQHLTVLTSGVRQLSGGDFRTRVPVRSGDEFGTLARAFNQMAEDLERHEALVVEQERLRRELELSRLIQTEMLPRAPLRSGPAEIAGVSIPAREVGGDFFNYFVLPDGRLALLVGDVSGKGVSAALLMANVQATLRARMPHEMDLAVLADRLDRELDQNTPGAVYLTLFLGILEMDARTLRYVNAGHNPQFVLRERGGIEPLSSTGLPIALYSGHGYREAQVRLEAGDLLFFYTDGLVETESETGDVFGPERLQALLEREHMQGIDALLAYVEAHVSAFRGKAEPLDDATMMALRIGS